MTKQATRTWQIGGGWGCHISWSRPGEQVYGHLPARFPTPGDLLEAPTRSGRTALFRFVDVKRERDPRDMFFADVEFVGYDAADVPMRETGSDE